ncbi:hypothetical protein AVEN_50828-1 [Araneus ventricosus]|uniref:Uncharacterized protein n=1 Tax=Araneus ventricosus TaxID=182803 RepID=A0A4Y2IU21_ARAVE|nr:hypothetical protein AVEN_50828-1 [Araneus ventricosus]
MQKETTRRPFETQLIPFCFRHKGTLSSFAMVLVSKIPLLDTLLEQQKTIVARGFLGLLEHSEKMLANDEWKSQYSSLLVFLIVYRSWDTDRKYIPNDNRLLKEQGFRQKSTFAKTGRNTKCKAGMRK